MENRSNSEIMIDIFLSQNSIWIDRKSEELKETITNKQRIEILERVARKGISFGIAKGISIEDRRSNVVRQANKNIKKSYINKLEMDINDYIMDGSERKKRKPRRAKL